jgi:exodeoxyribonuclease VII small subunit
MPAPTSQEERPYEQLVQELEGCVRDLEEGRLPLERAIERFKEGIALVKAAEKRLQVAEGQVSLLLQSEDGSERTEAFASPAANEAPAGPRLGTSAPAGQAGRPAAVSSGRNPRTPADDDIPF